MEGEDANVSGPLKIDTHIHLYASREEGEWWKSGYEIWEYGKRDGVHFSGDAGTLGETVAALGRGDFAHGVVMNLFAADLFRLQYESTLPPGGDPAERAQALAEFDGTVGERYVAFNRWLMDTLAGVPTISGFVAMDPWALSPERNVAHLREMAERGARGVKLHPVVQRFEANDPRLHPVYRACVEMGLAVLSHTGPARGGERFAEVPAFAPMLAEFPGLTVLLAHLGGGKWRDTLAVARAYPNAVFDLCEIIEWTGAPNAPTPEELARLIRDIGPERVVLGSDYPWYEPEHTAELVLSLPVLSPPEKDAILGENAARILRLPV
jgi:predicted TIM-barrel fold metal-dependent hydrolase